MKHRPKKLAKEVTPSTSRETRSSPAAKKLSTANRPIRSNGLSGDCEWIKQRRLANTNLNEFNLDEAGRFKTLVERDADDDTITMDELDSLQLEMEFMLMHNLNRQKSIINLQETLAGNEPRDFNNEAKDHAGVEAQIVTRSRSPSNSQFSVPKSKHKKKKGPRASSSPEPVAVPGPDKEVMNLAVHGYDALGRVRVFFCPMNHIPDKFWSFAEQFTPQLSPNDVVELEELAKDHSIDKMQKYLKGFITKTGKESRHSMSASPITSRRSSRRESTLSTTIDERRSSRRRTVDVERQDGAEESNSLGVLTERLVQALIDQQTSKNNNHLNDVKADIKVRTELANGTISPNNALIKSLNIPNLASLENRIKSELKSHGLLQNGDARPSMANSNGSYIGGIESESESNDGSDVDEVEQELKQRQKELHDVVTNNSQCMQELIEKSKLALSVVKASNDVNKANQELLNLFGNYYRQVPKRKPANKKERDQLLAALEARNQSTRIFDTMEKQISLNSYLSLFNSLNYAPGTNNPAKAILHL